MHARIHLEHLFQQQSSSRASVSGTKKSAVEPDYAFEIAANNIRYGNGVTQEVGMDLKNLGIKHVVLFTSIMLLNLDRSRQLWKHLSQGVK